MRIPNELEPVEVLEAFWSDLKEVGQGGPETGVINFGDWVVPGRYHPPVLGNGEEYFASRYVGGGFRLYSITPLLKTIAAYDFKEPYVGLVSYESGKLTYRSLAYSDTVKTRGVAPIRSILRRLLDMIS